MKKIIIKGISIFLAFAFLFGFVPVFHKEARAVTPNQQNIADRADFFFNTTWVCQKNVNAWRDEFVFQKGETYHLPYGQPVNSGKFIGYGVELEDFLMAAADADSVFYSTQSEFNGWTSVYYATDCAAFVAMCWGTVRQDCSTLPYYSTYKGNPTEENVYNILQLGDALDSTSVGHVVLVSDLIYDANGTLIQIEITEQTPPQLKRTYFTPAELAAKYGEEFGIYRYEGSVPAAPEWGYTTECTNYAAYCSLEITEDISIMSLPCTEEVDSEAVPLGNASKGQIFTATRLYRNTAGQLWYRIQFQDDVGYIPADETFYLEMRLDDISLTDAVYPSAHVRGKTFSLVGNIYSKYNQLVTASGYIYQGFGANGSPITGAEDYVTGNAYTLKSSQIDYSTSFGTLTTGNHTITFSTTYRNYYVADGAIIENSGTLELAQEYFMVVSSSTNPSSCNHRYTQTVLSLATCTQGSISVYACSSCGHVYKDAGSALGHSFGQWTVTDASCTQSGKKIRTCSICNETEIEVVPASGHTYFEKYVEGNCQEAPHSIYTCTICGDEYVIFSEEAMTPWQEAFPDDIDPTLVESKTQYRSSELKVTTSTEKELEGHTYIGEHWETAKTETLNYVKQFPSGFDTTNSLYLQYHKDPIIGSESENEKTIVESDSVTGYLYYHWCYPNSYYSQANKTGQYTTFHAYYSTTTPDSYRVDTSDWSYCTAHSTCSNTEWYFVAEVNSQTIVTQQKMYLQGQWQEYSQWGDDPIEASETVQVESRTLYRFPAFNSISHQYTSTTTAPTCTGEGKIIYTCSLCGDSYEELIPATGHQYEAVVTAPTCNEDGFTTYTCSCGDRYVDNKTEATGHNYQILEIAATCTEDGSILSICTACADTKTSVIPATGHRYENNFCVTCGQADPSQATKPTLTLKSPTLEFKDMICIVAFYTAENIQDVVEMGMITYKNKVDEWSVETADHVIPGAGFDEASGRYYSSSQGIHAKYLADTVYLACYAKLKDGSYVYTKLAYYSPITYAQSQLKKSTNTALKQLVVAMLNYGTEAQVYFNHNIENLANASLTAEQAALPEVYREDMVKAVPSVDAAKQGIFINNRGFSSRKPAISFEGAFCINYFFTPKYVPVDGITLYYWYEQDLNGSDILTTANASGSFQLDGSGVSQYRGDITGISAKNLSQAIYVAAVYSDGTTTWTSGILGYSIGTYCSSQASKGEDVADLAIATAIYGYHAKQYFG